MNNSNTTNKKIYFVSDSHLGVPSKAESLKREILLVQWLESIKSDASDLYLLGDIFDFWFEYKTVVPKGYIRLLGKLAELADQGINIHYFIGNHDMWMFNYLQEELHINIYREPIIRNIFGKKMFIGHGDGLGPADYGYKFIKRVFSNKLNQQLFRWLHPDIGAKLALYFSYKSRESTIEFDKTFKGEEERLVLFAKQKLQEEHFDYFIFGHRHIPFEIKLSESSRIISTGDWLRHFTYVVMDNESLVIKKFSNENS